MSKMTPVEAVARVIAKADGWEKWDTAKDFNDTPSGCEPQQEREGYMDTARIAITALAENVTEDMTIALFNELRSDFSKGKPVLRIRLRDAAKRAVLAALEDEA